jgi:hypothetical protein
MVSWEQVVRRISTLRSLRSPRAPLSLLAPLCIVLAAPWTQSAIAHAGPPAAASSESERATCATSYEQGQRFSREGKLLRAREELLVCARPPCSEGLVRYCAEWLREVERRAPSLIVVARTRDGRDFLDARVAIDGVRVAERVDGRALAIDPGEHVVSLERDGHAKLDRQVLVVEAEKSRTILFTIEDAPPPVPASAVAPLPSPAPRATERPVPATAFVAGGLGALTLGGFVVFAASGYSAEKSRLEPCRGHCLDSDVSAVRSKYILADVFLGLSIVSFGVAAYLILTRPAAVPVTARSGTVPWL